MRLQQQPGMVARAILKTCVATIILAAKLMALVGDLLGNLFRAIPDLAAVLVIFYLTRWAAELLGGLLRTFEEGDDEGWLSGNTARATRRIMVSFAWIAGTVIACPYIPGSGSQAFKGISVLLGLILSLGSTGLVNEVMSGFVVLYSGAVRAGEYARVGDVEGTVTEINMLSTKILTPRNEYVTVPNAVLVGKDTTNYSRQQDESRTLLSTSVTIGYDTPWRQVRAMLLLATDRTPGIRKEPVPSVLQTTLSDFYVGYEPRFVPGDVSQ